MERRLFQRAAASLALVVALGVVAGACGDDDKDDGGDGGGTASTAIAPFAFNVDIQSVTIPEGAGAKPVVTFQVTNGGAPVTDLVQQIKNSAATPATTPNVSVPRFTLAALDPATGDYTSYYTRTQTAGSRTETQANFDQAPTDATLDTRLTHQGNGVYRYELAALPAGATVDRARTHTAALWLTWTPGGADHAQWSTDTFSFVPAGGTATDTMAAASHEACLQCHSPALRAHDNRLGVEACRTCHSPQTTDADTGNSVNFDVMIHKIHSGSALPSVKAGTPYRIVGGRTNTSEFDFSEGVWPRFGAYIECSTCHQGTDASGTRWQTAKLSACTSCHDNVRFEGSDPVCADDGVPDDVGACRHVAQQTATANCAGCHTAQLVQAAHPPDPWGPAAGRFAYEIVNVSVPADRMPEVTFRVVNPTAANAPYDLATAPEYAGAGPTGTSKALTIHVAWQPTEYSNDDNPQPASPGQPLRMPIVAAGTLCTTGTTAGCTGTGGVQLHNGVTPVAGQAGTYTVKSALAIPENVQFKATEALTPVSAVTVQMEGHPVADVAGTPRQIPVKNAVRTVAVGGGAAPQDRRVVVATTSCNSCHGILSAHGANRNDETQSCVICHNPAATDIGRRGPTPTTEASIDFKVLVHAIHGSDIRRTGTAGQYVVFGFAPPPATVGTPHVFPLGFPTTSGNCAVCHTGTTYQLPLQDVVRDTAISTGASRTDSTDNLTTGRVRAVCQACHEYVRFTTGAAKGCEDPTYAPNTDGECTHPNSPLVDDSSCAACHGETGDQAVSKVHPIKAPTP